jgi:CRP/FNR family transcriptional regulator, cyclic AMP receptor protein
MRTSYGLDLVGNCLACSLGKKQFFCDLSVHSLQRLNEIKATAAYPRGSMLFMEGQQPRGVFVLCAGRAKLFASSFAGKTIIIKISEPGDVLGLNAVVANRPYEVTAEMMLPGQANFIPRDSLLQFRRDHGEVASRIVEQLSRDYYDASEEIRLLGLTRSPSEKFAKLLLSWWNKTAPDSHVAEVHLTLHHVEIAEILDTTRETVSRLFAKFEKERLLELKGKTVIIRNRRALEKISPKWES